MILCRSGSLGECVPYPRRRGPTQHAISVSSEKHMQLEVYLNCSDLKAVDGRWILITLDRKCGVC